MSKERESKTDELDIVGRFQEEFGDELAGIDVLFDIKENVIFLVATNIKELRYLQIKFIDPDYRFDGKYRISCSLK